MYQTIIRDPGGSSLIRIQSLECGANQAVVNGSILIVPPGTMAYVAINGQLSQPYYSGRYELFTGGDPFFVRLRHIMTRGDAGVTVSVFFISTGKRKLMTMGTGEFPFKEKRFQITMKALASCSIAYSIADPFKVLTKMVGSYNGEFTGDEIEPYIEQMALSPVREALSRELGRLSVTEFNSHLTSIGNAALSSINTSFEQYGLKLAQFNLTAINIPEQEIQRLYSLEQSYAEGKARTDLELDHLKRVWGGNIDSRTISEMMTGMPSRSQNPAQMGHVGGGSAGGMAPMMLQMMMMSQLLPSLREPLTNMSSHTDLFGGSNTNSQSSTSTADAPPPMPNRHKICPSCNGTVSRSINVCPICGYRF